MSIATRNETGASIATRSPERTAPQVSVIFPAEVRAKVTREDFALLAAVNRDIRLELTESGELIVMPPEGTISGATNFLIAGQLVFWVQAHGGLGFSSSTGFTLPNGAIRSPDASWISTDRWKALPDKDKTGFARIVPDFVIELRSPAGKIEAARAKMEEYVAVGVRLGWLIDPESRTVTVYRPGQEPRTLANPERVSGEDVLPGFELETRPIFSDPADPSSRSAER